MANESERSTLPTSNEWCELRNRQIRELQSLVARERRWLADDPDDKDRQQALVALQWAVKMLAGLPEHWVATDSSGHETFAELRDYATVRDAYDKTVAELGRYKRALYQANGFLLQLGKEAVKLDYGQDVQERPRNGWYRVEVSDHEGQIVAIERGMLAGREIGPDEERKVRGAIVDLSSFVGHSPVETSAPPVHPDHPPGSREPPHCSTCYCGEYVPADLGGPDKASEHASDCQYRLTTELHFKERSACTCGLNGLPDSGKP